MSATLQSPDARHLDLHLHIPTRTVVKVLATLVLVWAGLRLWPEFVLLLISLLLAVALHPAITALERRGLGRGLVVSLLTLMLVGMTVLLVTVVFTALAEQLSKLIQDFPALRGRVESRLPSAVPFPEARGRRDLRAAVVARGGGAPAPSAGARLGGALRHALGVLHADRDDLPAPRRQAGLRLAHRLHPAGAPRADGDHRRRGVAGRLRLRPGPGDHVHRCSRSSRPRCCTSVTCRRRCPSPSWRGSAT